ncbi:MAG: hypothetical protein WC326_05850 [Candidatus Delongbacteria bacterium]
MKRKMTSGALSVLLACACALPALAERRQVAGKVSPGTDVTSTTMTIDANQLDMFVTNVGVFAYDKSNARGKSDGLYFPNNYPLSDKSVIYDAGLWLGGIRGGDTLVTVAEYSQEFVPGMLGTDPSLPENRVYKIYKNHLDKVAAGFLVRNPDNHEDQIPLTADDYTGWPVAQGAPVGTDGTPWINELGADQMTYTVYNDGDAAVHGNDAGGTAPIGIEVRQTTFAFDRSDALGNVIFMKYTLIYSASAAAPLEQAYVSLWSDPDMGGSGDDYVGCDPEIGLGYCYNATNQDKAYGAQPPAVGFDFFKGPTNSYGIEWPPNSGVIPATLPMTSFNKYINGTDPHSYLDSYNYMRGLNIDGTPLSNGTTFQMSGDPVTGEGELDTDPADRRFMMSAGPFSMQPGDTVEVVAAVLVAQGTNRLGSITFLRFVDTFAQSAYEADFVVPQPPTIPEVTPSEMNRKVTLTWDGAGEEEPGSYPFQGYNVYQGETAAGPWKRIATYDLVDGVATIFEDAFDPETGEIFSQPAQFGTDAGVLRHIEITSDAYTWAGNPGLINGHPYYFGVSAYSYNPDETPNNLESSKDVVIVTPNRGGGGSNWHTVAVPDTATHSAGGSDGLVLLNTIDEAQLRNMSYSVSFYDTTYTVIQDPDTFDVTETWWRVSDSAGPRANGRAQSLDPASAYFYPDYELHPLGFPEVDGTLVTVLGPTLTGASYSWTGVDGAARWLTGVNSGGELLNGGVMLGVNFFGSTLLPAQYHKVEVRLTPDNTEWSDCARYIRPGYARDGTGQFPGSAWDVQDPANPRRLNLCFVENADVADGLWNPNDAELGGRHYLFVMDSDYNGGVDYDDDANWGPAADVHWAWWPMLRSAATDFATQLASGAGTFTFTPNYVNSPADEFTYTTTGVTRSTGEQALREIRAVPNPYYGHSAYETKSDVKVVKLINLPDVATIKIFNIAGDHVRTLQKSADTAHEVSWDLKNEYGVYVASGVYVYYVEAPGHGDTFGKMAVMLEEERLKEY